MKDVFVDVEGRELDGKDVGEHRGDERRENEIGLRGGEIGFDLEAVGMLLDFKIMM